MRTNESRHMCRNTPIRSDNIDNTADNVSMIAR